MQHIIAFKERAYKGQQVNIARDKTTVAHVGTAVSLCNNVINVWRR